MDDLFNMAGAMSAEQDHDATKVYEEWILSFGKARVDWKRWIETRDQLSKAQDVVDKAGFVTTAKRMRRVDEVHWKNIYETKQALDLATGGSIEKEVFRIFKVVFGKMRSRNIEIGMVMVNGWKLTVGQKGFCRRDNVQAVGIECSDMWSILKQHIDVEDRLRKTGFPDVADNLSKFASLVPNIEVFDDNGIDVPLKEKILLPPTNGRQGTGIIDHGLPRIADKISFEEMNSSHNNGKVKFIMQDEDSKNIMEYNYETLININAMGSQTTLLTYYQLHRQIEYIDKEYAKLAKPIIDGSFTLQERLKETFGKELLMSDL